MKFLLPLLILQSCFSCTSNKTTTENQTLDSIFGNQLIASNFLQYADSHGIEEQTLHLKKDFDIYDERNNKILFVDAEELAEFNFDFFLPQLNKILSKRNFHLDVTPADNYEISQEVFLNGKKIQLYTDEELKNGHSWDKAPRRFFKKLNELLKKNHAKESFFLLYSDNDLQAVLLTGEQQKIIAERYKDEIIEIPYKPQ